MTPSSPGPWGIYLHVPWCHRRCPYCAFYVEAARDVPWEAFVDRLLDEHARRAGVFDDAPRTVFLGGGTPSQMPPPALTRLLTGIPRTSDAEVTAEANPEDVSHEWIAGALGAGINRISLGIQTFNPKFARLLNRGCTVSDAREIARMVASSGIRTWSADVMFALPGQTVDDFRIDLEAILEVAPPHVSLYGLTFEPDTPFHRALRAGRLHPPPDDVWAEMYATAVQTLRAHGLHRYEISNFARPGHESTHNRLYWTDRPYLGLGPSAHGYLPDGTRYANRRDVKRYLEDHDPTETLEAPDPARIAIDTVVSCLRAREGLDLHHLARRTGHHLPPEAIRAMAGAGLVHQRGSHLVLTEEGIPVADSVVRYLVDHLATESEAY